MNDIYKKIASLKKEVGILYKREKNPFFNSKYFDINQLINELDPILEKYNLILLQPIINNCVVSKVIDIDTGTDVYSEIKLPELSDPQKIGSAITYYRRYGLQSLLGLQADDDDGNKASMKDKESVKELPWLNIMDKDKNFTDQWTNIIKGVKSGKVNSVKDVKRFYKVSKEIEIKINELLENNKI